ncbi:MAG: glycosyltransferase family 4 protein [Leptothrix sp. (in: b-proteobacteria)]
MVQPAQHHIGISFGQIGSLSDGLGEYSSQLALQFAAHAPMLLDRYGVRIHLHLPLEWHGRFGDSVSYLARERLHRYLHLTSTRFDIWHTLNQLSKLHPPLGSRHRLMTIHDLNQVYAEDTASVQAMLQNLRSRLARVDEVVTLTQHVENDIRTYLDWHKPVHVIPNGVRDLSSEPRTPIAALAGRSFFLHLSRLTASKNPPALLDLAAHWPEREFVLAGASGQDFDHLKNQIAQRQLHNVQLLGHVSDGEKAWLYAQCSAFLFPSLTEGFGLPPLEAMNFGKPVFVARRTCLPEVVGDCGGYFDDFEPVHMRQLIESGLPMLQQQQERIRAHARHYTWQRTARVYLDLYLKLLGLPALVMDQDEVSPTAKHAA